MSTRHIFLQEMRDFHLWRVCLKCVTLYQYLRKYILSYETLQMPFRFGNSNKKSQAQINYEQAQHKTIPFIQTNWTVLFLGAMCCTDRVRSGVVVVIPNTPAFRYPYHNNYSPSLLTAGLDNFGLTYEDVIRWLLFPCLFAPFFLRGYCLGMPNIVISFVLVTAVRMA